MPTAAVMPPATALPRDNTPLPRVLPSRAAAGSAADARAAKSRSRLDSLTGIRALAAFAVFAHHAHSALITSPGLGHLTRQGSSGVAFFFVLSGFVLTWSSRPDDTARSFYRRRVARILPLYLLAWWGGVALNLVTGESPLVNQLPALFGLQAWVPSDRVHFAGNAVLWSLSCEAFFYLVFPLVIGRLRGLSTRAAAVLLGCVLGAAIAWPVLLHPTSGTGVRYWLMYLFPPARFLEFAAGILLALLVSRGAFGRIPLGPVSVLAAAVYLLAGWAPMHLQPVALMLIPWALVIVAAAQHDLAGGRPAPGWLVRLGIWSYAFYLFHQLILKDFAFVHRPGGTLMQLVCSLVLLLVATALAGLLAERVEKPLERRLRGRPATGSGEQRSRPAQLAP
ncbi:MAG TPA: acyltransferase [Jatrophihabitans sp.]|nr:acyltransferase [Jatrophihabitans sp.]